MNLEVFIISVLIIWLVVHRLWIIGLRRKYQKEVRFHARTMERLARTEGKLEDLQRMVRKMHPYLYETSGPESWDWPEFIDTTGEK